MKSIGLKPRIELASEKKLTGIRITMSLIHNKTGDLWRNFMSTRKQIKHTIGTDLYSLKVYDPTYFNSFDPLVQFEKWAAIEVQDFEDIPHHMDTYILPSGLYAVFPYKGSSADQSIFSYIYGSWLPDADYVLDQRPHFEILGEKYKNNDPDSEEEIWIPVRPKPAVALEHGSPLHP